MKLIKPSLIISTSLLAMLVTIQSQAAKPPPVASYDSKVYNGAGCQPHTPGTATFELGGICNPSSSTSDLLVTCPVVRDNVNNDDGVLIAVSLGVSAMPVVCTAYAWGGVPGIPAYEVTETTVGGGFVGLGLILDDSVPGGSYSITCTLPAGTMSCILDYEVFEWEGSNDNMTDYNR